MDKPKEDPRTVKIRELLMDVYDLRPSVSLRLMEEIDTIAKRLYENEKLIEPQTPSGNVMRYGLRPKCSK